MHIECVDRKLRVASYLKRSLRLQRYKKGNCDWTDTANEANDPGRALPSRVFSNQEAPRVTSVKGTPLLGKGDGFDSCFPALGFHPFTFPHGYVLVLSAKNR